MKRFLALIAALIAFAPAAFASPAAYVNTPMDTVQATVNTAITNINAALPGLQTVVACTGTVTATCQGLRLNVSITGLTTAASTLSATMTVTDASVTAASQIFCQPNLYAGTGIPVAVNIVPAAGTFTFAIQNVSTGAALNATVVNACSVQN